MKRPTKSWQRPLDIGKAIRSCPISIPKATKGMTTEEYVRRFENMNDLVPTTKQESK